MTVCAALCSGLGTTNVKSETTLSARNADTTIGPSGASIATIKMSGSITPVRKTASGKPSNAQSRAVAHEIFQLEKIRYAGLRLTYTIAQNAPNVSESSDDNPSPATPSGWC